jgi:hypothetical protein
VELKSSSTFLGSSLRYGQISGWLSVLMKLHIYSSGTKVIKRNSLLGFLKIKQTKDAFDKKN